MGYLFNLGISELEIKNILENYPNIQEIAENEIYNKIEILKNIGCNTRHIKNIIISNPNYLDRSDNDVLNLVKKLIEIGITNINLLLDSYPYFLNKDYYEIDEYVNQELNKGNSIEDIVDKLESDPSIIDII